MMAAPHSTGYPGPPTHALRAVPSQYVYIGLGTPPRPAHTCHAE
jgi:hypothetical protein